MEVGQVGQLLLRQFLNMPVTSHRLTEQHLDGSFSMGAWRASSSAANFPIVTRHAYGRASSLTPATLRLSKAKAQPQKFWVRCVKSWIGIGQLEPDCLRP
jgi:hypothetical protein